VSISSVFGAEREEISSIDAKFHWVCTALREREQPIQWWQANEGECPILSQLAYDLLSIPAMSAKNERVSSGTKELLKDKRNALLVS
jgi:hypothetical protein